MSKTILVIIIVLVIVCGGITGCAIFTGDKEEVEIVDYYFPGDYFITNIKDSDALLKATVVLELNRIDVQEELTSNNHIIRDVIIFLLREKTYDELRSDGIEDILREEIKTKLASQLGIDYITTIYFNDFIIQ